MNIIPAIDIIDGKCVQLVGGRLGTEKFYGSPIEAAKKWISQGAELLHVIDLDATLGKGDNLKTVLELKKSVDVPIQFGGGIRTVKKAKEILETGIDRIIIGTMAVEDYMKGSSNLEEIAKSTGWDRVIAAIDSKKGFIVCKGWQQETEIKTVKIVKELEDKVWGFLYTNVDVEGQMKGVDMKSIKDVVK